MRAVMDTPSWWPPKPGDKLRHFTLHGDGRGQVKQVHALVHVVAVFDHDDQSMATVAEWFPTKRRWHYETICGWLEAQSSYWPDGQPPPKKHERSPGNPCDCCKDAP